MRYRDEQTAKIKAVLKMILIDTHDRVMDAGCGTGLLFDHISGKAKMIIGLDISRKTLNRAKERANKFPNTHLILADADYIPIKKDVFNFLFALTLIQNMPSPSETLKEIRRVTMEKANLVITGLKTRFSREEFMKILSNAGLKPKTLTSKSQKYHVAICRNAAI